MSSVVLDLGCGTGVLGFLALRAGASHVHAVDSGPILEVARLIARQNGFEDRITFHRCRSTELSLPEPVDVIVADQLGPMAYEAGLFESFRDARERLLRVGGRLIPGFVESLIAPVEVVETRARIDASGCQSLDFSPFTSLASNIRHSARVTEADLLSPFQSVFRVDLKVGLADERHCRAELQIPVNRDGSFHGFLGCFRAFADATDELMFSNMPGEPSAIDRNQVFLPAPEAIPVSKGDVIQLALDILLEEKLISWSGAVSDRDGITKLRFSQSTFRGELLTFSELRKHDRSSVPVLSRKALQFRAVVTQIDGKRSLAEIETSLRGIDGLFESDSELAAVIAEVMRLHDSP